VGLTDIYSKNIINKQPFKKKASLVDLYEGKSTPVIKKSLTEKYNEAVRGYDDLDWSTVDNSKQKQQSLAAQQPVTQEPVTQEPVTQQPVPQPEVPKAVTTPFTANSQIINGTWSAEELKLFNERPGGCGRGEVALAMHILTLHGKSTEQAAAQAKTLVQGEKVSFDILDPQTNERYEVKETVGKDVRLGAESIKPATILLNKILSALKEIHDVYYKLPASQRDRIESHGQVPGYKGFADLLNKCYSYFAENRGALPAGAYRQLKIKNDRTPKLYLVPQFLQGIITPQTTAVSEMSVPSKDRIDLLQDLYGTDRNKAKVIDIKARDIAHGDENIVTDEERYEDFIHVARVNNILSDPAQFQAQITDLFSSQINDSQTKLLQEILPNTGIFVVSNVGWQYVGKNNLQTLIVPTVVTQGKFKIELRNK